MAGSWRAHWREYVIEAGLLAAFMVSACGFGTLLWHPASPVAQVITGEMVRRAVMGCLMGLTAIALIYSPAGKRSGAHMNPALTLTFFRLGRVARRDAAGYFVAQFAGAILGVLLMAKLLGSALADPHVRFVVTQPGPQGGFVAFLAEVTITGILVLVVLESNATPRLMRYTGISAGLLVATWITFEAPLSGMSMNPARTLGSAFSARSYTAIWIYFTAPPLGMLLGAQVFLWIRGRERVPCAKLCHAHGVRCIFCEHRGLRTHPDQLPPGLRTRSSSGRLIWSRLAAGRSSEASSSIPRRLTASASACSSTPSRVSAGESCALDECGYSSTTLRKTPEIVGVRQVVASIASASAFSRRAIKRKGSANA